MKDKIININSISELCELAKVDKPTHPLIHIVDVSQWEISSDQLGIKYCLGLYCIGLKDKSCGMLYGRNSYDFDEGVLFFTAPNQVTEVTTPQQKNEVNGWMLFFHPDLIRNTRLGASIENYGYFSYDVNEALHLSEREQKSVTDCVERIKEEILERIDNHSHAVIISNIELLLNYCLRYYERQFTTRKAVNIEILSELNIQLKTYYEEGNFERLGHPSVHFFAEKVKLTPHYLSDLLRKETGKSAKEHMTDFVVDKAKTLLLSTNHTVSEVAYLLGFNYPHYFSRLFRSKTGFSPKEYREQ